MVPVFSWREPDTETVFSRLLFLRSMSSPSMMISFWRAMSPEAASRMYSPLGMFSNETYPLESVLAVRAESASRLSLSVRRTVTCAAGLPSEIICAVMALPASVPLGPPPAVWSPVHAFRAKPAVSAHANTAKNLALPAIFNGNFWQPAVPMSQRYKNAGEILWSKCIILPPPHRSPGRPLCRTAGTSRCSWRRRGRPVRSCGRTAKARGGIPRCGA